MNDTTKQRLANYINSMADFYETDVDNTYGDVMEIAHILGFQDEGLDGVFYLARRCTEAAK